ncbi:MAG TPA: hypothetical protein VGN33_05160 [Leifsonia sp.]|nr:hypothetical protein [Leifsonia sp.]
MEKTDPRRPEQLSSRAGKSGNRPRLPGWTLAGMWAGRALVVITVAAVVTSWLTHPSWAAEGWEPKGYPRSWVPNVTLVLVLATGIFGQWLCGLAASPNAAWRDGDELMAETVAGRRRIRLPGALVITFRVLGRTGTTQGAFLIDRRFRVLVLVGPFSVGGRPKIDRLVGRRVPDGYLRAGGEYLVGLLWILLTCAAAFVLIAFAAWMIGMIPS